MGRSEHRATLLRLALMLMTSDSNDLTRGPPNGNTYVYRCPNGHTQRLRQSYDPPPRCKTKGCGQQTEYVPTPDER
jgi:hypothetical protein